MEPVQGGPIASSSSDDDIEITSVSGPRRVDLTNIPTQPADILGDLLFDTAFVQPPRMFRRPPNRKRKRDL